MRSTATPMQRLALLRLLLPLCLGLVAAAPRAAAQTKAVEKDGTGALTANLSTGNRTLTIASGGTLNAVAGSNIILAGTTTLSGNITSNATLTGGTLANITATGTTTLNGTISGNAVVPLAQGGTGSTSASAARTSLGLAIGTNVQAYDADLTTLASKVIPSPGVLGHPSSGNVLRGFFRYLETYRYNVAATVDVVGLGSSVGNGAGLADPTTNSPLAHFVTTLGTYLNRINTVTLAARNYSLDGGIAIDAVNTRYPAAVAAGYPGKLGLIVLGMNDGRTYYYNAQQDPETFATQLATLVDNMRAQGCEPIIVTTPHPHSTRTSWSMNTGTAQTYPTSVSANVPDESLIPPVSDSTPSKSWQGVSIPVSRRHAHVNEQMRRVATRKGVALIDAERYWFDAVAAYGQDALYDAGEYVHPNLLGYQLSYHAAINDFVKGLFDTRSWVTVGAEFPTGAIVGATDTQTLTNKTLTAPAIDSIAVSTAPLTVTGPSSTAIVWLDRLVNPGNPASSGYGVGTQWKVSTGSGVEENKWAGITSVAETNFGGTMGLGFYTQGVASAASAPTSKMTLSGTGNLTVSGGVSAGGLIATTGAVTAGTTIASTGAVTVGTTLGTGGTITLGGDFYTPSAGSSWGADSAATGLQVWGTGGGGNANTVKIRSASTDRVTANAAGVTLGGNTTIQGVTATGATGTGNIVFATSPTISGTTLSGTTTLGGDFYSASGGSTWGADSGASGFQIWGTGGGGNANKVRVRAASTTILDATTGGVAITGNATVSANLTVSGTQNVFGLPSSASALATNSTMTFERTSDTSLTIKVRGSDGTTRSVVLTLAP